jgi:hypothetical protein
MIGRKKHSMRIYQVVRRRKRLEALVDHAAASLVSDEREQVELPHAGEATDETLDFFKSPLYSGNQILEDVRPDDHVRLSSSDLE